MVTKPRSGFLLSFLAWTMISVDNESPTVTGPRNCRRSMLAKAKMLSKSPSWYSVPTINEAVSRPGAIRLSNPRDEAKSSLRKRGFVAPVTVAKRSISVPVTTRLRVVNLCPSAKSSKNGEPMNIHKHGSIRCRMANNISKRESMPRGFPRSDPPCNH